MSVRKTRRFFRAAAAPLLAAGLSGCFLNPDSYPPTEIVNTHALYHSLMRLQPPVIEPQVETVSVLHPVRFVPGSSELPETEVVRLIAFLNQAYTAPDARVEIDGPRGPGGFRDGLAASRVATLSDTLADFGVPTEVPQSPIESLARPEEATIVVVTRAMVIEPDCSAPKTIYTPRPTHTWSCTSAVALGRMVANPLDLERGRATGPADGTVGALAIQRYREDKIKTLKVEGTGG